MIKTKPNRRAREKKHNIKQHKNYMHANKDKIKTKNKKYDQEKPKT
jgi:hypothetical protein